MFFGNHAVNRMVDNLRLPPGVTTTGSTAPVYKSGGGVRLLPSALPEGVTTTGSPARAFKSGGGVRLDPAAQIADPQANDAGLVGLVGNTALRTGAKRVDLGIPGRADIPIALGLYVTGRILQAAPKWFQGTPPVATYVPPPPVAQIHPIQGIDPATPVLTVPLTRRQVNAATQQRMLGTPPDPNLVGGPHPLARTSSFARGPRLAIAVGENIPTGTRVPPPPSGVTYRSIPGRTGRIVGTLGTALRSGAYLVLLGEALDKTHGTAKVAVAGVVGGPQAVGAVVSAQIVYKLQPLVTEFANDPARSRIGVSFSKGLELVLYGLFGGPTPDLQNAWGPAGPGHPVYSSHPSDGP